MKIRAALESDAPAIARVHIDSWRAAYRGIIPDDVLDNLEIDQRRAQWSASLNDDLSETIVAHWKGEIIGFASFGATRDEDDDPAQVGEIMAVYIAPKSWRRGIGRGLCEAAVSELSTRGFAEIVVWMLKENHRARGFYESVGFCSDGTTKLVTIGVLLEECRYRRVLRTGTV